MALATLNLWVQSQNQRRISSDSRGSTVFSGYKKTEFQVSFDASSGIGLYGIYRGWRGTYQFPDV